MWWLWGTEEEEEVVFEEQQSQSQSQQQDVGNSQHRSKRRKPRRGRRPSAGLSQASSVSSKSSYAARSRFSRGGLSRQSGMSGYSRTRRNPNTKVRGRPQFVSSTFSVRSGASLFDGDSSSSEEASGRTGRSVRMGRSSNRSVRSALTANTGRSGHLSRSSLSSRPQQRRVPRSQRIHRHRRGSSRHSRRSRSRASRSRTSRSSGRTLSHFERLKQSFFGAIADVQEQIQMTIAEMEYDDQSESQANNKNANNDNSDDDTVQYDNTGRVSLQPANPQNDSLESQSYFTESEEDFYDDDLIFARAITVMRFAIFADAVNSQVLGPNYALLVEEGTHPDSFPSTEPFGFGAAYYFMPMAADIGMVLSSVVMGYLSDKPHVGRTRCILMCMYFGTVGSLLKYFARHDFWTFCAANFFTGLFGGSLAVGMAYVSDIFIDRMQTDAEIGIIVATNMIGRTGGGVLAICMQSIGLFEPLLVSAGISLFAGLLCHVYMCDVIPYDDEEEYSMAYDSTMSPSNRPTTVPAAPTVVPTGAAVDDSEKPPSSRRSQEISTASESLDMTLSYINEDGEDYPNELDMGALLNVLLGELFDNLGSIGLVPICLAPLMWQTFYAEFVEAGEDPIMSSTSYKWIYVFVALVVIPGAVVAPALFARFGPAMCAVMANLLTGAVTIVLLQIANIEPPTFATYCIFVSVLYCSFPLTVISQLSTGPMLDRIAPLDQRGQIQGLNMAAMNTATALGPFLYGILTDMTSVDITLYVTTGVSVLAAFINYQLTGDERFGPSAEEDEDEYGEEMSGMDPSSMPTGTSEHPSRSPGSYLPSVNTASRSIASFSHDLHVEFLPSFF